MFQIKICGITSPEDALLAAEAGADAIGLNFYEQSPRYVNLLIAQSIAVGLPPTIHRVGVFVNAHHRVIQEAARYVTMVQLHGDEKAEDMDMTQLSAMKWPEAERLPLIKALRCPESDLTILAEFLMKCPPRSYPAAFLIDAYSHEVFGGSGLVCDWERLDQQHDRFHGIPFILAGGLTPDNVAEAIATARPDAVDVASGVESSPGKKDPDKVRRFIAEARQAFAELPGG